MTEENEYAPLKGIKVVDWTQVQSGPSCTQLLAWLGAEVIKIERTNTGDPTRNELFDIQDSWSLYYLQLNANKKSLTLNIKTDEGKKIMYDLAKKADVFVENIAPGSADRNGFGWEKLHALKMLRLLNQLLNLLVVLLPLLVGTRVKIMFLPNQLLLWVTQTQGCTSLSVSWLLFFNVNTLVKVLLFTNQCKTLF